MPPSSVLERPVERRKAGRPRPAVQRARYSRLRGKFVPAKPELPSQTPQQSLRTVVVEYAPYRAAAAIQEEFTVPFGLVLQATAAQAGILSTLPRLASALIQLVTPRLLARFGERRVIAVSALLGSFSFAGAASVVLMPAPLRVWGLLTWSLLCMLLSELPQPAWGAWVGNLVSDRRRGRYLALRFGVGVPASIAVYLVGGLFLDASSSHALLGFTAVFATGSALRLSSAWLLRRLHEPSRSRCVKPPSKMRARLRDLPRTPLGRYMLLSFCLYVSTWVASPYIGVYELRDLHFSYLEYMALVCEYTVVMVIGMRFWGPFADRRGNMAGIRMSVIGIALLPILWVPVHAPWHAIPAQTLSGISWGCMTLCGINYVYHASTRETRAANVALFNALNGLGIFTGAVLGGLLQSHLPSMGGLPVFATLMMLSSALRGLAALGIWTLVPGHREEEASETSVLSMARVAGASEAASTPASTASQAA